MPEYNPLSRDEEAILLHKRTEAPGTGRLLENKQPGTYICRRCNNPLYRSADKFESGCGWPSFDDEIPGAVLRLPDADGRRTEIVCANCGGHLGHVFTGERYTIKNTRHCVNSLSMQFIPEGVPLPPVLGERKETAYFAGGCFWGVEHLLKQRNGVVRVRSGYMGGDCDNPSYRDVCTGETGHAEAVEVVFVPETVSYEELAKLFFEIHDFTQIDGQGPDIGDQYRSAIFTTSEEQERTANKLIGKLIGLGYAPATTVQPAGKFWPAEDYHQNYYDKTGKQPYCHRHRPVFPAPRPAPHVAPAL